MIAKSEYAWEIGKVVKRYALKVLGSPLAAFQVYLLGLPEFDLLLYLFRSAMGLPALQYILKMFLILISGAFLPACLV